MKRKLEKASPPPENGQSTLYRNLPVGVFYQRADGKVTDMNPEAERILGVGPNHMSDLDSIGSTLKAIRDDGSDFPPEDHPGMLSMRTGKPVRNQLMGVYFPGETAYHWVNFNAVPQFIPGKKKPYQAIVVVNDATERRQVIDALRRREEQYRLITDNVQDVIWKLDVASSRFTYVSPSVERLRGYTPEEVMSAPMSEALTPDSQRIVQKALAERMAEIRSGGGSHRFVATQIDQPRKDGTVVHTEVFSTLITDAQGELREVMGITRDITERLQAEKALTESYAVLNAIIDSTTDMIWSVDSQAYGLTRFNQAFLDYFLRDRGIRIELGMRPEDLFPTQDYVQLWRRFYERAMTEGPFSTEYSTYKHTRILQLSFNPLKRENEVFGVSVFARDITERNQMEDELRESEIRFRALSENSLTGIYIIQDGRFTYVNRSMAAMFGYETDDLTDTDPLRVIHPDDRALVAETMRRRLAQEPVGSPSELRGICKNGETITIEVLGTRIILHERPAIIGNLTDITERKKTEAALRAANERFLQLADSIQEAFWMRDADQQKIIYISPAYATIWGRTCEGLYRNSDEYIETLLPEDRPILLSALNRQAEGERTEAEYRVQRPDGSIRWIWDRSFPIVDDAGKLVRTAGVALDITEEKKARDQLEELTRDLEKRVADGTVEVRKSEATYRALFESSNDGIFLISADGEPNRANQRAIDMLGYTPDEFHQLIRCEETAAAAPGRTADADARFAAALRGESVPLFERTFTAKDGRRIHTEINLSPVRDVDGKVVLMQCVVRDVTPRKKAEQELRESRDQLSAANTSLEKASHLKDEFLASMSHELRTPLTGILGLSEALQMQTYGALSEKQAKALKNIEYSGRHLLELINDILDLSKIEAGRLDMQFEPCSVADICQSSLQLVKGMARQKNQNVSFSINPASITVRADARRLKQMLVNLLSNAVKFTPEGGALGLEVQAKSEEKAVLLTVWDKGIGISPREMDRLFKPFVQLDSSLARQYAGTGLGLSLVHRMAKMHGGGVTVESVVGEGSRFTIRLPWHTGLTQPLPPAHAETISLNKVLVVEDIELDAERVRRFMQEAGIRKIVIQPMAEEAFGQAVEWHPDAILLDLHLPDGFGLNLLAQLKGDERTRDIPVIITSIEERRSEARKLGVSGYLVKPFSLLDLRTELEKAAALVRPAEPETITGKAGAGPLVMIADDNELIVETLSDFLEAKGYRVAAALDGFALLNRAAEVHPDIMLVDIQMPGMDGLETIRRLRAHADPAIALAPIIAVTALAMTGDREKCLSAGATEYLSKPLQLQELVAVIQDLLDRE